MNDADAREYAISALGGVALELYSLLERKTEDVQPYVDLASKAQAAAHRLHVERDDEVPSMGHERPTSWAEWRDDFWQLSDRVVDLEEKVDELGRRVIGGPPVAGVVVGDGGELDREPPAAEQSNG